MAAVVAFVVIQKTSFLGRRCGDNRREITARKEVGNVGNDGCTEGRPRRTVCRQTVEEFPNHHRRTNRSFIVGCCPKEIEIFVRRDLCRSADFSLHLLHTYVLIGFQLKGSMIGVDFNIGSSDNRQVCHH